MNAVLCSCSQQNGREASKKRNLFLSDRNAKSRSFWAISIDRILNWIHGAKLCSSLTPISIQFVRTIRCHIVPGSRVPLYSSTLHRRYPSRSTRNRPRDSYCLSFPVVIITDKSLSSGWRFNVEPDALHPY